MGADTRDNGSIYLARQLERNEVETARPKECGLKAKRIYMTNISSQV